VYNLTAGRVNLKLLKMKKVMFTAVVVGLGLTANVFLPGQVMAQVPNYVPTNGLVGYWPFNGNANDESGNGNNGTVNGATLTNDRNGNVNKAYVFDGINDFIQVSNSSSFNLANGHSISVWFNPNGIQQSVIIEKFNSTNGQGDGGPQLVLRTNQLIDFSIFNNNSGNFVYSNTLSTSQSWQNIIATWNGGLIRLYQNSVLIDSIPFSSVLNPCIEPMMIGKRAFQGDLLFNGVIDDIGMWNRALTQQEITVLYNSCTGNEITTQPTNAVNTLGANAQFSLNAVAGSTYQWQSNPSNFGWQNVPSNASYSGATTNTLTVSNTTISNHNQPFRAIVNVGGCIDTSNVAQIIIGDTCLTTVTDTLIINTTLGLPAPNNENTILIYPNPASDHITIDNGNFAAMAGYTIKIENNAGQQVFQSAINQAQFYVDLSTWTGNGLYFVHLIDPQNNTVTVRKIVLQ
jgi:hypothetical protein